MSPTCLVLSPSPGSSQFYRPAEAPLISAAGPVELRVSAQPLSAPHDWVEPLVELRDSPSITFGSVEQLQSYQAFVAACLSRSLEAASCASGSWRDSGLPGALARGLRLASAGKAAAARTIGCELIGFAKLAQQLRCSAIVDSSAIGAPGEASASRGGDQGLGVLPSARSAPGPQPTRPPGAGGGPGRASRHAGAPSQSQPPGKPPRAPAAAPARPIMQP